VSFNPPSFSIPARSEFGLEIIYRPLLAIEQNSKITLKSVELGEFVYPLKLQGLPVNTMRTIYYKAPLGTDVTLPYKFLNYTKKPTTYQCVVTKLGNNGKPVPVAIDPKAKGAPVSATDFNCEVA
jgi:hydrocephalus-inducing protein